MSAGPGAPRGVEPQKAKGWRGAPREARTANREANSVGPLVTRWWPGAGGLAVRLEPSMLELESGAAGVARACRGACGLRPWPAA